MFCSSSWAWLPASPATPPDDLLSGNGLRIIDGILKSLPLVGTYISFFLFGGEFPGIDIVARLYTLHIMIVPLCSSRSSAST